MGSIHEARARFKPGARRAPEPPAPALRYHVTFGLADVGTAATAAGAIGAVILETSLTDEGSFILVVETTTPLVVEDLLPWVTDLDALQVHVVVAPREP